MQMIDGEMLCPLIDISPTNDSTQLCMKVLYVQWNPSIVATIGERLFGHYRGVATSQEFFCFYAQQLE